MRFVPFPGCCTARILLGFGETNAGDHLSREARDDHYGRTYEQKLQWLVSELAEYARRGDAAHIVAMTTTQQQEGIRLLTAAGFVKSDEGQKNAHRETNLISWVKVIRPVVAPAAAPVNAFVRGPVAVLPEIGRPPRQAEEVGLPGVLFFEGLKRTLDEDGDVTFTRNTLGHFIPVETYKKSVRHGYILHKMGSSRHQLLASFPVGTRLQIHWLGDQDGTEQLFIVGETPRPRWATQGRTIRIKLA